LLPVEVVPGAGVVVAGVVVLGVVVVVEGVVVVGAVVVIVGVVVVAVGVEVVSGCVVVGVVVVDVEVLVTVLTAPLHWVLASERTVWAPRPRSETSTGSTEPGRFATCCCTASITRAALTQSPLVMSLETELSSVLSVFA
jgi:hypothetical protein